MTDSPFSKIIARLSKKQNLKIGTASQVAATVEGLSTGNLAVDYVTGVGGLPKGRIVELYGPPASGKTTTALQTAAELQRVILDQQLDLHILYLDFEQALDPLYCASLGLDVEHDSFVLVQPAYLEQGGEISLELMRTGKVALLIVDSVASMAPRALFDGDFDQRTAAMNRARLLNSWLLRLIGVVREHNACAVFINHLTESIQMTGPTRGAPSENTPGGKGLKFYASLRMKYQQVRNALGTIDDGLTAGAMRGATSTIVKVKVTKNKVGPPFREAEVRVRFGRGFDNCWSALQVLIAHGYVKKSGAHYKIDVVKMPDLAELPPERGGLPKDGTTAATLDFNGADKLIDFADEHASWRGRLIVHAIVLAAQHGAEPLEAGDFSGDPAEQAGGVDDLDIEELAIAAQD